ITTFAVLVSFHYFSLESIIIFSQLKYASKVRFFGLTLGAHYSYRLYFFGQRKNAPTNLSLHLISP
ncbi:hypothetical protein, partial [Listeria seeligeri]|uniref:hypothetical protein n=1 Tax=Listeria seeligeri TaxID=1640 RepID=UPI0022EA8F99